jgi:hypothetical protein
MDRMAEEENKKERRNDPGRQVYYNFTVGLQNAGRPHTRSNVPESARAHRACQLHTAVRAARGMPATHCSAGRTGHASYTLQQCCPTFLYIGAHLTDGCGGAGAVWRLQ